MEVKQASIDKEAQETLNAKQIELGISDEKEMRRTELNFYCEFLSMFKKVNQELDNLNQVINIISTEKLTDYFKTISENYKKEEVRANLKKKISKSHKKAETSAKNS